MSDPVEPKSKWRTPLHPLWPMSMRATLIFYGLLFVLLLLGLMFPSSGDGLTFSKLTQLLSNARQIHLALQRAALDGAATGNSMAKFAPFESKIKSTHVFLLLLTDGDYIPKSALEKLEKGLLVTNFSVNDPPETVILVSRSMVQNGKFLTQPSDGTKEFVIFNKGGYGAIYKNGQSYMHHFPPRTPVFLDP